MAIIKFDVTCRGWDKNPEINEAFIKKQREYIIDMLCAKGYVYLNQIYEVFGAEWNPDNDNIYYRLSDGGLGILFEPSKEDNTYLIRIYG